VQRYQGRGRSLRLKGEKKWRCLGLTAHQRSVPLQHYLSEKTQQKGKVCPEGFNKFRILSYRWNRVTSRFARKGGGKGRSRPGSARSTNCGGATSWRRRSTSTETNSLYSLRGLDQRIAQEIRTKFENASRRVSHPWIPVSESCREKNEQHGKHSNQGTNKKT